MEEIKDTDSRVLFLYDEINNELVEELSRKLILINKEDEENSVFYKDYILDPIKIIINSPGGDYDAAFSLIRIMEQIKAPVETICYSFAGSGAFLVFISGDKRILHEDAILMHHDLALPGCGWVKTDEMQDMSNLMMRKRKTMNKLVKRKTDISQQMLDEIYTSKQDKFFTLDEIKDLNIADEIIKVS